MKNCTRHQQFHKNCIGLANIVLDWYQIQDRINCGCRYVFNDKLHALPAIKDKIYIYQNKNKEPVKSQPDEQMTLII
jgi:hypothetical protein